MHSKLGEFSKTPSLSLVHLASANRMLFMERMVAMQYFLLDLLEEQVEQLR